MDFNSLRKLREAVQLQFEDGVDLRIAEAQGIVAPKRGQLRGALEAVLAAVQLDAFDLARLAVLADGDVLLGEIFEQVVLGVGAAGRPADDADDVVQMIESDLVAHQNVFALFRFAEIEDGAAADDIDAVLEE